MASSTGLQAVAAFLMESGSMDHTEDGQTGGEAGERGDDPVQVTR